MSTKLCGMLAVLAMGSLAGAQAPVYQHHAGDGGYHGGGYYRPHPYQAPNVAAGSYQRPYPYHLDYYKMRYGGSYAPYFGNLYGPPAVVASPYYGAYAEPAPVAPQQLPQPAASYQLPAGQVKCPHCGAMFDAAQAHTPGQ